MILEGLKIMILGMGTVFIMLIALIIATAIASRIIAARGGGHAGVHPSSGTPETKPLTAIIAAAVALFRSRKNLK